jgi:hypothetical protein
MIELVRSNDPVLNSFATSLLTEAGIQHSVADSQMSVIDGSIGAIPTRVLVTQGRLTRPAVSWLMRACRSKPSEWRIVLMSQVRCWRWG